LAIAAVFEDITGQTNDLDMLVQVIDLASKTPPNLVSTAVSSGQLTNPNSPFIAGGKRLLSILFGNRENALLASMSRESGLRAGAASVVGKTGSDHVETIKDTVRRQQGEWNVFQPQKPGNKHSLSFMSGVSSRLGHPENLSSRGMYILSRYIERMPERKILPTTGTIGIRHL
jgi:hypothetical protein